MGLSWTKRILHCDSRTIAPPVSLSALRQFIAKQNGVMLESVSHNGYGSRYSIFAIHAVQTVCIRTWHDGDPFNTLADIWRPGFQLTPSFDGPFAAGWIGFLGYEAGRFAEPSAGWDDRTSGLPLAYWSLYDTVLLHDAHLNHWTVAGVEWTEEPFIHFRPPLEQRLKELEAHVCQLGLQDPSLRSEMQSASKNKLSQSDGTWNESKTVYLDKVRRILAYIRAGDVFQVNLARRFRALIADHPMAIYQRLCEANPAAYAAYVPIEPPDARINHPCAVISSSPELFMKLQGRQVTTRPIKGTRPRGATQDSDTAEAAALARSQKDRAELNMIIDLERNDLGRVCEYGSVRVVHAGQIEPLPTVFHRTATITGRLRDGLDAIDLLRAGFPGGSITGAPKVRAMQIINELEKGARGPYCGAIGYVGLNGELQLNLAIRTMTLLDNQVDMSIGSGIVADSDPEEEYEEIEAKASGMMAALRVRQRAGIT